MVSCRVEQSCSAKADVVYDVLMDFDRWANWLPTVSAATWERRGDPETGKGGVRRVRFGLSVARDEIVAAVRPHHHAYIAGLGWYMPIKDYRGDVRIDDRQDGSVIVWTASCVSRILGLNKLFGAVLQAM